MSPHVHAKIPLVPVEHLQQGAALHIFLDRSPSAGTDMKIKLLAMQEMQSASPACSQTAVINYGLSFVPMSMCAA